jgi:hypothetical protein
VAAPFKRFGNRTWMLYDDCFGQVVAIPLHRDEACTLAHTLNVADLVAPATGFGQRS